MNRDGSLEIRKVIPGDGGKYVCEAKNVHGNDTISTVVWLTTSPSITHEGSGDSNDFLPLIVNDIDYNEPDSEVRDGSMPLIERENKGTSDHESEGRNDSIPPTGNDKSGQGSEISNASIPLIRTDKNNTPNDEGANKSWIVILLALLIILIVIVFIIIVMYKDRRSQNTQSIYATKITSKKVGNESQYALKDCIEVDEEEHWVSVGSCRYIKKKEFDNQDNIKNISNDNLKHTPEFAEFWQNCQNIEKQRKGKNVLDGMDSNGLPTEKSNIPKSNSLFDCTCDSQEKSSFDPCFK